MDSMRLGFSSVDYWFMTTVWWVISVLVVADIGITYLSVQVYG